MVKKLLCVLMCFAVLFSSVICAFAAITYPEGVTEENALEAIEKTDTLVKNALKETENTTVSELIYSLLFSDDTLNSLLVGVYSEIEKQNMDLSSLNIVTTPAEVAKYLTAYPTVALSLAMATSWQDINLDLAVWGIKDKAAFSAAVASRFGPFNSLLMTLLCSKSYPMGLVSIQGDEGYQNSIVPMLQSLGCTDIKAADRFKAEAEADNYSMVKNIVNSIFSLVDAIAQSPVSTLSERLPGLSYYLVNGGFEESIKALISPLNVKVAGLVSIMNGNQILEMVEGSTEALSNPTESLNAMLSESGITIASLDLQALSKCGTVENSTVKANKSEAFIFILRWLIETIKLNKDNLPSLLGEENAEMGEMLKSLGGIFEKDTDELVSLFVKLLTKPFSAATEYQWPIPTFSASSVNYTQNLSKEKFQRVVEGIDELVDQFVAESTEEKSLKNLLKKEIYSPKTLSALVIGLYSMFDSKELAQVLPLLEMDLSPKGVAAQITQPQYYKASTIISAAKKWKSLEGINLNWGFSAGNYEAFRKALTAALRPLSPALKFILAEGKIEFFDTISIGGAKGYNVSVIPILEALGCPSNRILSYEEYKTLANASADGAIKGLLDPIFSLINTVFEKPIYTLTLILPNIIFFLDNGGLSQCIKNLVDPFTAMLSDLGFSAEEMGVDLSQLTETDIIKTLETEATGLIEDIVLPPMDLSSLGTIGKIEVVSSKATYHGVQSQTFYVRADQEALMVTILRFVVEVIRMPANSSLLTSFTGGGEEGGNQMFAQFSTGIGDEMAKMTTDETVEWLYKLFFRERAIDPQLLESDYEPNIIYKPKKQINYGFLGPLTIVLIVATIMAVINRSKITDFLEEKKKSKKKTTTKSQEV